MNALITGATSGIGLSFAKLLASKGYNLILVGRNQEKLDELQQTLMTTYNVKIKSYSVDLTQYEAIEVFCKKMMSSNISLNLVINNAGIGYYGLFMDQETTKDQEVIATNILALTVLTKKLYPCYRKGTRIIQVASTAGFAPGAYMGVYYASKSYVISLSLALREEWKKEGIGVCVLCPGPTKTDFQSRAQMKKLECIKHLMMTSDEVVKVGYEGMIRNKALIIPGRGNQLASGALQMIPLQIGAKIIKCTQQK